MAVERVDKPPYRTKYAQTPLATLMGVDDRFNTSWNTLSEGINKIKPVVIDKVGVGNKANLRRLTPEEYNLLANRFGWGGTNTYEWLEEEYRHPDGPSNRLFAGDSDNGGAAYVYWRYPFFKRSFYKRLLYQLNIIGYE